jgi:hypothetical protein
MHAERNQRCCYPDCPTPARHGLGWGLSTGLVEWYCADHYAVALSRLGRLLWAVGQRVTAGGQRRQLAQLALR